MIRVTVDLDAAAEAALLRLCRGSTAAKTMRRALMVLDGIEARRKARERQAEIPAVIRMDESERLRTMAEGATAALEALASANDGQPVRRPGLAKGRTS